MNCLPGQSLLLWSWKEYKCRARIIPCRKQALLLDQVPHRTGTIPAFPKATLVDSAHLCLSVCSSPLLRSMVMLETPTETASELPLTAMFSEALPSMVPSINDSWETSKCILFSNNHLSLPVHYRWTKIWKNGEPIWKIIPSVPKMTTLTLAILIPGPILLNMSYTSWGYKN